MGNIQWTDQQLDAINIRNTDTLVSAAAGSGKTAVLVERVIKQITDSENPVDIDKLLVVTFTNAAANQMKEKISKALVSAIKKDPENHRLRNQLILLGNAEINTIHSFCMNVIRNNIQDTDLPFEFGIINDTEKKMLLEESMDDVFSELYEDVEFCEQFENFVDSFSGNDDENAVITCLNLYDFLRSMPFYLDWLKKVIKEDVPENVDDTVFSKYILGYTLNKLRCAEDSNKFLCEFLTENAENCGLTGYCSSVFGDTERISVLKKSVLSGLETAYYAFNDFTAPTIGKKDKDADEEAAEFVKKVRHDSLEIIKKLKSDIFVQSPKQMTEILRLSKTFTNVILEIMVRFDAKYSEKKTNRGVVDFSDLEHKCADILSKFENGNYVPTDAAIKLRERFREVLVDEYQDTNFLQETIIGMVSAPGKRFMVGDVKQSIYSFRNSKPQLFLEKYNTYSDEPGYSDRRLLLTSNFRSASHILDFVNFIFSSLMVKELGGLDYGENEKLYYGNGYNSTDSTDLYIFDSKDYDDDLTSIQREANFCASKIREMVDKGYEIEDNKVMRKCSYGDFTIVIRNANRYTDIFREAFDAYSIPLYVEKGSTYFDAPEIKLFVSLLKIIDNPRQEVDLAAVLRSHIFGFSEDMLVDVRLIDPKADYFTCLKKASDNGLIPAQSFFEQLKRWRFIAGNLSVRILCETLMDECNMFYVYPEGRDKLNALCDWAERYSKTSYKGLFRFITFLQNQIEANEDIGGNGKPATGCVSLMSIHKSKGLENGIIILADTAHEFNTSDIKNSILFNDKLGLANYYCDTENRIKYNTVSRIAAKCLYLDETRSEELRLLYVALTRARYKLIITGSVRGFESKINKIKSLAVCVNENGNKFASLMQCNSFLEWLLSALTAHPGCREIHRCGIDVIEKSMVDFDVNITINPAIEHTCIESSAQIHIPLPDSNYPEIKKILEYEYSYPEATTIPSKLSVSEIKSRFYAELTDDETVFYPRNIDSSVQLIPQPGFLSKENKLSASAIGTAYHSILQYLDFNKTSNISDSLDKFVENGIITKAERDAVDMEVIEKFLHSDVCREISDADNIYKEYSFIIPFDSSKLFGGASETIMVQGIIDCVYRKNGEFYVVDYKSDYYSSALEISDRYRTQLIMYSEAVEKKLGKKPAKCMLYMLRTGEII